MTKVLYPDGIRAAASRFGCDLPMHANLSRFGFDITAKGGIKLDSKGVTTTGNVSTAPAAATTSAPTVPAIPSRAPFDIASRAVASAFPVITPKGSVKPRPTVLALPLKMDPNVSLAIADKLLGDPTIKNAEDVVTNTIAIAQLPRESANAHVAAIQRGAAVLDAAQQIREVTGAAPGQAAIPVSPMMQPAVTGGAASSAYTLSDSDIAALEELIPPERESLWHRFLHWLESL